ncbi:MAG: hypothetical protein Q9170_008235, partial [Blastenia crenularia]
MRFLPPSLLLLPLAHSYKFKYASLPPHLASYPLLTPRHSCNGSTKLPRATDCEKAMSHISPTSTYTAGAEFSVGNCYVAYLTDGT